MPRTPTIRPVEARPFHARYLSIGSPSCVTPTNRVEVLAVVAGAGCWEAAVDAGEGARFRIGPGQVLVIRPTDRSMVWGLGADGLCALSVGVALADWLDFIALAGMEGRMLGSPDAPVGCFDPADDGALAPFYEALRVSADRPTRRDLVKFLSGTMDLLAPPASPALPEPGSVPAWLSRALRAMRTETNLAAGLPRLLEVAGVGPAHLSDTTRRYVGTTPTLLVREMRLLHAARLLAATTHDVRTIAERCGFPSPTYFSTAFRTRFGMSPRAYRGRHR